MENRAEDDHRAVRVRDGLAKRHRRHRGRGQATCAAAPCSRPSACAAGSARAPARAVFADQRITGHLYDRRMVSTGTQGLAELKTFTERRWRGFSPILWGVPLMQADLQEALLLRSHGPGVRSRLPRPGMNEDAMNCTRHRLQGAVMKTYDVMVIGSGFRRHGSERCSPPSPGAVRGPDRSHGRHRLQHRLHRPSWPCTP